MDGEATAVSRMPWRCGETGRLSAAAAVQRLQSSGRVSSEAAGCIASGPLGRRRARGRGRGRGSLDGVDIDDHIRLALREEAAATLGRAGRKLRETVAALAEFDLARAARADPARTAGAEPARTGNGDPARTNGVDPAPTACATRRPLLADAARALWEFVVQREAAGVTDHDLLDAVYGVTPELWRLMGSDLAVCTGVVSSSESGSRRRCEEA